MDRKSQNTSIRKHVRVLETGRGHTRRLAALAGVLALAALAAACGGEKSVVNILVSSMDLQEGDSASVTLLSSRPLEENTEFKLSFGAGSSESTISIGAGQQMASTTLVAPDIPGHDQSVRRSFAVSVEFDSEDVELAPDLPEVTVRNRPLPVVHTTISSADLYERDSIHVSLNASAPLENDTSFTLALEGMSEELVILAGQRMASTTLVAPDIPGHDQSVRRSFAVSVETDSEYIELETDLSEVTVRNRPLPGIFVSVRPVLGGVLEEGGVVEVRLSSVMPLEQDAVFTLHADSDVAFEGDSNELTIFAGESTAVTSFVAPEIPGHDQNDFINIVVSVETASDAVDLMTIRGGTLLTVRNSPPPPLQVVSTTGSDGLTDGEAIVVVKGGELNQGLLVFDVRIENLGTRDHFAYPNSFSLMDQNGLTHEILFLGGPPGRLPLEVLSTGQENAGTVAFQVPPSFSSGTLIYCFGYGPISFAQECRGWEFRLEMP